MAPAGPAFSVRSRWKRAGGQAERLTPPSTSVHGLSVSETPKRQSERAAQSLGGAAAVSFLLPVPVEQGGGALAFSASQQTLLTVFFVAAVGQHDGPPLELRQHKDALVNSRSAPSSNRNGENLGCTCVSWECNVTTLTSTFFSLQLRSMSTTSPCLAHLQSFPSRDTI